MAKYRTDTGLELDEDDAEDRKILDRQRSAAREAGRNGGDRASTTRGRADLEAAYDEGAGESSTEDGAEEETATAPRSGRRSGRSGGGRKGRNTGGGKSRGGASVPPPRLIPPRSLKAADWGGFGLGLVLYALAVSYIRYGSAGPTGWLSAKFLNKPIQGDDLERENKGGSSHEDPNSVPWEDLTPEERENII